MQEQQTSDFDVQQRHNEIPYNQITGSREGPGVLPKIYYGGVPDNMQNGKKIY